MAKTPPQLSIKQLRQEVLQEVVKCVSNCFEKANQRILEQQRQQQQAAQANKSQQPKSIPSTEATPTSQRVVDPQLQALSVGDKLDGANEPTMNGLSTKEKQERKSKKNDARDLFPAEEKVHAELSSETVGIIEACSDSNRG